MTHGDPSPDDGWLDALQAGDADAAWDSFIAQYRRLIFATIRHYARDHDDVMDAFAHVCTALHENGLARVQRYWDRPTHTARFSSWLVTVVRHQVIDWFRQHRLHQEPGFTARLSPLQRQIFNLVFLESRSHLESYELIRTTTDPTLAFADYVRALRETYDAVAVSRWKPLAREVAGSPLLEISEVVAGDASDPGTTFDTALRIANALNMLEPEERSAVELFVVHEMPAAAIARALRWPNAKAVYNRVYRALAALRARLKQQGIEREDL